MEIRKDFIIEEEQINNITYVNLEDQEENINLKAQIMKIAYILKDGEGSFKDRINQSIKYLKELK